MSVAITASLSSNSTRSIPVVGVVVTVTVRVDPAGMEFPPATVSAAVGVPAPVMTLTVTGAETVRPLTLSVARAVRIAGPGVLGVQTIEKGEVVSVPMGVPFARNCTLMTDNPAPAVALALTVTLAPTAKDWPAVGAVIATVGVATVTLTVTGAEKRELLLLSTTSARSVYALTRVGVQVTV